MTGSAFSCFPWSWQFWRLFGYFEERPSIWACLVFFSWLDWFMGSRETPEVKCPYITSCQGTCCQNITDVNLGHLGKLVPARFLHWKVTTFPFPYSIPKYSPHLRLEGNKLYLLKGEYPHKWSEIFLYGKFDFFPAFIYSLKYLYQHKLVDIYLTLLSYNPIPCYSFYCSNCAFASGSFQAGPCDPLTCHLPLLFEHFLYIYLSRFKKLGNKTKRPF